MDKPEKNQSYAQSNLPEKFLPIKPLSRFEMHQAARKRISKIKKEFREGFKFLEDYPLSVTFFGSSRLPPENEYYKKAQSLARRISEELILNVITGGGPGIMEAANRGAFEAGGRSVGITIKLPKEQITNKYLTAEMPLYYFFTRKVCLNFSAEAFVFFPGGFGTLDEFFEIVTLIQTKKIQRVPVILFGSEYWRPLEAFLQKEVLSRGMIDAEDLSIYSIEDDENVVLEKIRRAPMRTTDLRQP